MKTFLRWRIRDWFILTAMLGAVLASCRFSMSQFDANGKIKFDLFHSEFYCIPPVPDMMDNSLKRMEALYDEFDDCASGGTL